MNARVLVLCGLLGTASWQFAHAGYIHAKAILAQRLLERSWQRSLDGVDAARPWPWADTWPVARLRMARLGVDEIVLAGSSGRTLAFGPAHVDGTALPGAPGLSIVAGHRDTHFEFLRQLAIGDELQVDRADGASVRYRVSDLAVLDARAQRMPLDAAADRLELVTCFPFDAVVPGGPLRYRVLAERVSLAEHALVAGRRRIAGEHGPESKVESFANEVM
ncbi:MAG TPA: class GN sortase [Steroidobacteraceae bacterium]|jgi:sortase A|nr:class GN sortase [Steroidobacteraceae bacterium]